jgi:uncharacterized membrane protein SpoIIM required for sporulation
MDYARFVATRRSDWEAVRTQVRTLRGRSAADLAYDDLDALAARHRAIVADFAYARTRFRGSEAEGELRALAFAGHRMLTPPEAPLLGRVGTFFRVTYPARFRASLPALRVALALFVGGLLLGLVLTTLTEDVAQFFVGASYVDQLRAGTIWTDELEGVQSAPTLAARIFTNNISVALFAWAGGALLGAGTVYAVGFNGAMVGSLLAVCVRYGLVDRLFAFIPAHGLLELFLVTVAGAAGLELAAGLVLPGEVSRGRAFALAARRSLELVGGTVPWFVLLGLVEGFLSPLMGVPTGLKVGLGVLLLVVFLVYALLPPARRPT